MSWEAPTSSTIQPKPQYRRRFPKFSVPARHGRLAAADDGIRWYRFRAIALMREKDRWYLATSRWCSDADLYLARPRRFLYFSALGYRVPVSRHPAPGIVPAIQVGALDGQPMFVRLRCERDLQSLAFSTGERLARQGVYPGFLEVATGVVFLAILAAGLAIVTRSLAFAFAALSGAASVAAIPLYFAQWFPTLVMPPYWLLEDCGVMAFYVSQWLFYDCFFELRKHNRSWRAALLVALGCAIIGLWAIDAFLPLRWFDLPALPYLQAAITDIFYGTAAVIAIVFARRGNRSAWFVAAGTAVYISVTPCGQPFGRSTFSSFFGG